MASLCSSTISLLINKYINENNDLLKLLELYPNKDWNYFYLSFNPNITREIAKNNLNCLDKKWNYYCLSSNPNITWEIVRDNPDKGWNYYCLSSNPNITWEIVRDNPDKGWNYTYLSSNPNITWEIVRDNPDKEWSYTHLSENKFLHDKNSIRYKNLVREIEIKEKERILNILKKEMSNIVYRYLIPIIRDYIL
jgi:hypothetical protein